MSFEYLNTHSKISPWRKSLRHDRVSRRSRKTRTFVAQDDAKSWAFSRVGEINYRERKQVVRTDCKSLVGPSSRRRIFFIAMFSSEASIGVQSENKWRLILWRENSPGRRPSVIRVGPRVASDLCIFSSVRIKTRGHVSERKYILFFHIIRCFRKAASRHLRTLRFIYAVYCTLSLKRVASNTNKSCTRPCLRCVYFGHRFRGLFWLLCRVWRSLKTIRMSPWSVAFALRYFLPHSSISYKRHNHYVYNKNKQPTLSLVYCADKFRMRRQKTPYIRALFLDGARYVPKYPYVIRNPN